MFDRYSSGGRHGEWRSAGFSQCAIGGTNPSLRPSLRLTRCQFAYCVRRLTSEKPPRPATPKSRSRHIAVATSWKGPDQAPKGPATRGDHLFT